MKIFHNPEIRKEVLAAVTVIIVLCTFGFLYNIYAGMLVLGCGVLLFLTGLYFAVHRYRAIARLSEELIDKGNLYDRYAQGTTSTRI